VTTYRVTIPADTLAARQAHTGLLARLAAALGVGYQGNLSTDEITLWLPAADPSHASTIAAQILALAGAAGNAYRVSA
jgi:hypothetical protein